MSLLHGFERDSNGALQIQDGEIAITRTLRAGVPISAANELIVKFVPASPSGTTVRAGTLFASDGAPYISTAAPQSVEKGVGYRTNRALCVTFDAPANSARRVWVDGLQANVLANTDGQVHVGGLSFVLGFADLGSGAVSTTPLTANTGVSATFTRATTATTIGSTGLVVSVASGTARSYYSPDGTYLGYLAEGQRINICQRGEDFTTVWANVGTPTLSAGSTTLGALSLSTLGDDDGAALEGKTQTITHTGDAVKAYSIYVKKGTATSSVIRLRDTTASADRLLAAITWSGTTPVVTMTTGTDLTGTPVQHAATGVYRLMFATTAVTAANTNSLQLYPATDAALSVANTGTIEWGGVQAEDATFPSSLIQTPASASVTRNADVLTYPTTGWLNALAGTVFASAQTEGVGSSLFPGPLRIDDGTTNNRLAFYFNDAGGRPSSFFVRNGGVTQADVAAFAGPILANTSYRWAGAYSANDFAVSMNGGAVGTDTAGTIPTLTTVRVGAADNDWFGPISRTAYSALRNPNAVLQQMTT